jgi:S1-C subfamily serine protease
VSLTIVRNGKRQQIRLKLGEFNADAATPDPNTGSDRTPAGRLGVELSPLTPDLAEQLGIARGTQGVVIAAVDPAGPAAEAGLRQGDVIQQINRQPVRAAGDVQAALDKSGDRPALLQILRGGQTIFVGIRLR